MQGGYREAAPENAIVVSMGPLGLGRIAFMLFPLLVMFGGALFLVAFTFSMPAKTPGALDCRRTDDSTIQCHGWLQGGYSHKTEGKDDELRITSFKSRSGTHECLELRAKDIDCVNPRGVEARLRALRPGESVSFDRTRLREHVFLYLAGFMLLVGVLIAVLVASIIIRRREKSWVKVTPQAVHFPDGQIARVEPEGVRAVWVAKNRYEIQYGREPQWHTVHGRYAFAGDLDPFAGALRDALAKMPFIQTSQTT
jgi:hypothetical protein